MVKNHRFCLWVISSIAALSASIPTLVFSQVIAKSATVDLRNIRFETTYRDWVRWEGESHHTDTTISNISISLLGSPKVSIINDTTTFRDTESGNTQYQESFYDVKQITLVVDAANVIKLIEAEETYSTSDLKDPVDIWSSGTKRIYLTNLPYAVSRTKDTMTVSLNSTALSKILTNYPNTVNETGGGASTQTSWNIQQQRVLALPDSASLHINIVGSFDLAVLPKYQNKGHNSDIFYTSGIVIISHHQSKISAAVQCYDILGRKHDLEFLSADNTSATYSVRSLRPGVYFVNDDRETMKFMIGE